MIFRSYVRRRKPIRPHAGEPPNYPPSQLAVLYGAPTVKIGAAPKLSLLELGGGYSASVINQWCDQHGYPRPTLTVASVDGATNAYTGDPQSADVEVHLDICAAIGVVYAMTGGPADVNVLFAPNSGAGFLHAVQAAAALGIPCGISWGGPEDQTDDIAAMDAAMAAGVAAGATFCCAAGDSGSGDGEPGDHADYPGSSPYALCCGGTSIVVQNGAVVSETPWNDTATTGDGATGGGYSAIEAVPVWQQGFVPAGKRRGVPDLAAAADPDADPWDVAGFGGVGGTSAVAPFLAGFLAVCRAAGWVGGSATAVFYAHEPDGFRDIVQGNNGDFSATKGWDPASGLGAPILSALFTALVGNTAPTPPPPPSPTGLSLMESQTVAVRSLAALHGYFGLVNQQQAEAAVVAGLAAAWPDV